MQYNHESSSNNDDNSWDDENQQLSPLYWHRNTVSVTNATLSQCPVGPWTMIDDCMDISIMNNNRKAGLIIQWKVKVEVDNCKNYGNDGRDGLKAAREVANNTSDAHMAVDGLAFQ